MVKVMYGISDQETVLGTGMSDMAVKALRLLDMNFKTQ